MPNLLFRRLSGSSAPQDVKPGDSYRRSRDGQCTETATVLNLCSDPLGIPHVRFAVAFERPSSGRYEGGLRTLALRSFVDAYRDRIP